MLLVTRSHPATFLTESDDDKPLREIQEAEAALTQRFRDALHVNPELDRTLVSFQANKRAPTFRWFRFKEGFSANLVDHLFDCLEVAGPILDPFAGCGTTLHVSSRRGVPSVGIELLPVGVEASDVHRLLQQSDGQALAEHLRRFAQQRSWEKPGPTKPFHHLYTTTGAFPTENQRHLERFVGDADLTNDALLRRVLRYAAMCVLESVSYTSKDGQFLRWDRRAGRRSTQFEKPKIRAFTEAIQAKLEEIADDLEVAYKAAEFAPIELRVGSCLDVLPRLPAKYFGGIITSPPFCNRYDYTRTYALELAMLGVGDAEVAQLRQRMLCATVEQRPKEHLEAAFGEQVFEQAMAAFYSQELLAKILEYLWECQAGRLLNNAGIPRMVENYFREMALVIFACGRVLRPGAPLVMVNDNVRYQGVHIPVDLILADFAVAAGLDVEAIWVLPHGKGNSSQQMGRHGRKEVRKCVYVWRKRNAKADDNASS